MTYKEKIEKLTIRLEKEVVKLQREGYMTTTEMALAGLMCTAIRIAATIKDSEIIPKN